MTEQKYLDPKEAARLMLLDGEVLVDTEGEESYWSNERKTFVYKTNDDYEFTTDYFEFLRRKPQKTRRLMTRWECLAWASSAESQGWVVKCNEHSDWYTPQHTVYFDRSISDFRRAKLLPDGSGIDESTITDFSVEVEV
jgi:hypothetical protein